MTLSPAYGRDYKSKAAVLADFEANKDFLVEDITDRYCGEPVNREQILRGTRVNIRYSRLTKVVSLVVK